MLLRSSLVLLLFTTAIFGEIRIPAIFSDNMVMQRDSPVAIWGNAAANEEVTVHFAAQAKTVLADASGRWKVTLDRMAASAEPRDLTIGTRQIHNVLVGEVWLASGQSNMAYPVSSLLESAALLEDAHDPQLRFYTVVKKTAAGPQDDAAGKWELDDPKASRSFSAVAYYFARELRRKLQCPVAIVHSSWGGTPIETWISLKGFQQSPALSVPLQQWNEALAQYRKLQVEPAVAAEYESKLKRWRREAEPSYNAAMKAWNNGQQAGPRPQPAWPEPSNPDPMSMPSPSRRPQTPAVSYNAMIAPIIHYSMRGVLWYQGEANGNAGLAYRELLPRLIADWRRQNGSEFPFLYVQLPMNGKDATPVAAGGWPWLREAQLLTLARAPHTGMAVTIDVGNPNDVHPTDKLDVGHRLALLARHNVYGEPVAASGPLYAGSEAQAGRIVIHFHETGSGLVAGQAPWRAPRVAPLPTDRLLGFYISGADRRWVEATAKIDGDTVVVSSSALANPVAVRYAWANSPQANLYNREGLPASPFRSDDWDDAAPKAASKPVVFWKPDSTAPGDAVLLYGGGLAATGDLKVWRVQDAEGRPSDLLVTPAAAPSVHAIQPNDQSLKFIMPANLAPGVFAALVPGGPVTVLNRPELWFLQPTTLQPGLKENEALAGNEIQVVGKDFLLPGDIGKTRLAFESGNRWIDVPVSKSERFSLRAQLPAGLPEGRYKVWVQNGFGGPAGWGGPLLVDIRHPQPWPTRVFDVKKDFGAKGDDVTDDTAALQGALAATRQNGGGVVYLPWGIYRLSQPIVIPPKTVLRGEQRDAAVLMWPVDEPKSVKEFSAAAIFAQAPYAVEDLTIIARKVDYLLEDVSFGQGVPLELKAGHGEGEEHDVFIRRVNFQHWIVAGRNTPADPALAKKYGIDGVYTFGINGVTNFEWSGVQTQGGSVHLRGLRNARETGNTIGNEMGYCWAEMGGGAQYVVSEQNEIRASSSWGYGHTGMKYVYSAHNRTYNFVRGEREAMTLDISALPTAKPGKNMAWFGHASRVDGIKFSIENIKARPDEFAGLYLMVLDGPGKGQFREVVTNTPGEFTVDRPWDVQPDPSSTIGLWTVMQHMIVYASEGYDCSAFAQLWGSFYDYIVDSNRVERNQGIWGQSGWFVQFRYNDVLYANTYHPGIGPGGGPTPEKTMPFSFVGLTSGVLRVTKFGSSQYDRPLVMVDDVAGEKVPGVLGAIVKGNQLSYNQRVAFPPAADPAPKGNGEIRMYDVLVDGNTIEHSPLGVQIGSQVRRVLVNANRFRDVGTPYALSNPAEVAGSLK